MPTIKKRSGALKIQEEQEIVTLAHKVQRFLAGYKKHLQIAAVIIVVVIVLFTGFSIMRSAQEKKATPLVAVAYEYYSSSTGTNMNYGKALDLFRDVQKKYPDTVSGVIAQYYIGNCLVNLGRPDEALKEYQIFVDKYSHDKFLLGLVYQRIGYADIALGKRDDARKAFEQAETLTGPGVATVELAKLYEAAGNMPEAEKKYKVIMESMSGTSWAKDAMGKVQKISPSAQTGETKSAK
ncbi:MAG TPA: tetratricopeptide repeat protein [Nitrospirota bacterium]|nr:tetratricopeptide repeat protein [Nitrospirota bacterium]